MPVASSNRRSPCGVRLARCNRCVYVPPFDATHRRAAAAFWMVAELRERAKLIEDQRALPDQMVAAATARFSTSAGMQADVLRAQLEVDRLAGEQRAIAADVRAAEAMRNIGLARSPDAPILGPLVDTQDRRREFRQAHRLPRHGTC